MGGAPVGDAENEHVGRGLIGTCPCTEMRLAQATTLLARATTRGETGPTPQQALDHVVASLYYRAVFGLAVDSGYVPRIVGDVLRLGAAV